MTQYNQNPYPDPNQPQYGYTPADPYAYGGTPALRMCRGAAIGQSVFGVFILLLGFCVSLLGMFLNSGSLPPEQQAELGELTAQLGESAGIIFLVTGICVGIPGLLQIILAIFVWKGAKWAIITSVVVNALFGVLMLLNLGSMLVTGTTNPLGACMNVAFLAAVVGLIVVLVNGYRESSRVGGANAAYAAQWQQYYQQYQAYQAQMNQQGLPPQPAAPSQASQPPLPPTVQGGPAAAPPPRPDEPGLPPSPPTT